MSQRQSWTADRTVRLERLWVAGTDVKLIADELRTSRGAIYTKANQLGLKRRKPRGPGRAPAHERIGRDTTKQRRFTGVVATGQPHVMLNPHDPRLREGLTIFPTSVVPASKAVRLLKSGEHSRKIGRAMAKGRWARMPLFTLTLEERETCPRTCLEWATCYGNNMHLAHRIMDDGTLTRRLWGELAALNAEFPAGYIVRLHVLGDFYSRDYVRFWREALRDFPALRVFGFTARRPPDPIGNALVQLVADEGERFMLRFSGGGYETHCAEVVDSPDQASGILCPAESDPNRSCATCGLCMQTTRTISFVRH